MFETTPVILIPGPMSFTVSGCNHKCLDIRPCKHFRRQIAFNLRRLSL